MWRWRCDKPAAITKIAATTESGTTKTAIGGVVCVAKAFGVAVADDIWLDSAPDGADGRPNIREDAGTSVIVAGTLDIDVSHPGEAKVGIERCNDIGGEPLTLVSPSDWSNAADKVGFKLRLMALPDAEETGICLTPTPRGCWSEGMRPVLSAP